VSEKKENNVFISDCGNYIAIRIPGPQPTFDVWRHDGSEFWEGTKYVPVLGEKGCYIPRTVYTDDFAHPKKIVGSWTNLGHDNRKGEWVEAFELTLDSIETGKGFFVEFHTPLRSLAPQYRERRASKLLEMGGTK
jgi:hypothetical protein